MSKHTLVNTEENRISPYKKTRIGGEAIQGQISNPFLESQADLTVMLEEELRNNPALSTIMASTPLSLSSSSSSSSSVLFPAASSNSFETLMTDVVMQPFTPVATRIPEPHPWEVDFMIVHQPCMDGTTAIFAAYEYTEKRKRAKDEWNYEWYGPPFPPEEPKMPVVFGVSPENSKGMKWPVEPDVRGKNVAVFDISFDAEKAKQFMSVCKSFVLFDHHQGGQERMPGVPNCHFNMNHSGGWLAWKFFFPGQHVPEIVKYTQDHDLYHNNMRDTHDISTFMFSELYNPQTNTHDMERWHRLHNGILPSDETETCKMDWAHVAYAGSILRKPKEEAIKKLTKVCAKRLFHGYMAVVANAEYGLVSDGCAAMLEAHGDADVAILWQYDYGACKRDKVTGKPIMRDVMEGRCYPNSYVNGSTMKRHDGTLVKIADLPDTAYRELAGLNSYRPKEFFEDVVDCLRKMPHFWSLAMGIGP